MTFAVIIPVLDSNRYHEDGDLASFGELTLLEWKIIQLKEVFAADSIHVLCEPGKLERFQDYATPQGVTLMERAPGLSLIQALLHAFKSIGAEECMVAMTITPLISPKIYSDMLESFRRREESQESVVSVRRMQEHYFFKGEPLNFSKNASREILDPVYRLVNGCYISPIGVLESRQSHFGANPLLFEIDDLAALEIKQVYDLEMASQMIFSYFVHHKNDFQVRKPAST